MYKRILLAYDGSQTGQQALLDCRDIANLAAFYSRGLPTNTASK